MVITVIILWNINTKVTSHKWTCFKLKRCYLQKIHKFSKSQACLTSVSALIIWLRARGGGSALGRSWRIRKKLDATVLGKWCSSCWPPREDRTSSLLAHVKTTNYFNKSLKLLIKWFGSTSFMFYEFCEINFLFYIWWNEMFSEFIYLFSLFLFCISE